MPVDMPDVVAPSDQLPDVAFDAAQWGLTRAVGVLGGVRAIEGVQQAEIHRCRQQAVRHETIAAEHSIFMRAEVRQPISQEDLEGALRFGRGDGELARAVTTDERYVAVALPAVQVGADLLVDLVFIGSPWRRGPKAVTARRRGLAVVGVEIPPALRGLVAVHQQVEPPPRIAVEVLQLECVMARGPVGEALAVGAESAREAFAD